MTVTRVAVIFDNQQRPETTGSHCLRSLWELANAQHFLPNDLSAINRSDFDLFLRIDDGLDWNLPPTLRPTAWWAIDTHLGFDRCLTQARTCDLAFAAQRRGADELRFAGIAAAVWLPLACDPVVHCRHDVLKQFDACFVGNLFDGPRADLVSRIRKRYPSTFVGNRYFDEMARTYSSSRIVFNRSILDDVNMRVFEAVACGSLLLTNDLPGTGQDELFQDGVHLATYRGAEEMLDKIAFYLARPAIRSKIEDAGMREAVAKHTYRHRMAQILEAAERLPTTVAVATPVAPPSAYDPGYFEFERPELVERVPAGARRVLDVGCGAGRLGEVLKRRLGCHVTGLEFDPAAAAMARRRLDEVLVGDAETMDVPFQESLDAIVCGDVLEHMREPLAFLRRARDWLKPDGRLVTSIPNVRHHSVVRHLLAGHWTYEPAGLLDRTHLRFFTRREIEKLLFRAGFVIEWLGIAPGPDHAEWVRQGRRGEVRIGRMHIGGLTPKEAEEFHVYQYLVVAKLDNPVDRGLTSIVILTHNLLHLTRQCIDSIRLVTDEPYELILVDNGSTDGTPHYLRSLAAADSRIKVVENAGNRGFPAGCNQGIAAASGRQVMLLNNDTIVTTGWLRRLLDTLHASPQIGLVGPCSDNVSGEQQIATTFDGIEELDGFAWDLGKAHHCQVEDTDRLVGFCLLIRREVIDRVGVLDERFGIGCYEDDDYCRRVLAAGYRAVIARDAFIHHAGGATFRSSGIDFGELMRVNEQRFREKWQTTAPEASPAEPRFDIERGAAGGLLLKRRAASVAPEPVAAPDGDVAADLTPVDPDSCLCMIVRDNKHTIGPCLTSIRPHVGKMVVVDTGSKDDTPRICRDLGAEVHYFQWCDDFSAARNESLRHARGGWVFWMDSDDVIDEANGRGLAELVRGGHDPGVLGYVMQVHCPGRSREPGDVTVVDHVKLFRNRPDLRFEGRIHEQILGPIRRAGGAVEWTDLFVLHAGYDHSPEGQERKKQRDFRLLQLELAERPDHPFTLFNLGMTCADVGEHAEAVQWLQRCLANSHPEESHLRKAHSWLVLSLAQTGRLDEAMRQCETGLKHFPLDVELRFRRGLLLYELKRYDEAIAAYEDVLARSEERHFTSVDVGLRGFKTRQNLAVVLEEKGDWAAAERQWRAVVAEAPRYRDGWRGLGRVLIRSRRLDEAIQVVEQLKGDPSLGAEAAVLEADVAIERRDLTLAQRVLEEALRRFPRDGVLLQSWSRILFEYDDPVGAEPHLRTLLDLDVEDAASWHNLGTVLMLKRQFSEAADAFGQSLRFRPESIATQLNLSDALMAANHIDDARQLLERTLRTAPDHPEVKAALDKTQTQSP